MQYIIIIVLCQDKYEGLDILMARIIDGDKMNMIGANLRKYRTKRHLSQQTLSNKLELLGVYICRGSISRVEEHKRTVTDIELFALAKVLDIPMHALFEDCKLED